MFARCAINNSGGHVCEIMTVILTFIILIGLYYLQETLAVFEAMLSA